ncbi:hypothetical protein HK105_204520 [Polyrhizophydium stewartii]|uniref:lipoyl(octanoyl) transferase n=1 Tax=Polyrhizophydium stewartii TaxID=2732419 RepID=A0ABR4N8G7_9FUNG|nr:putative lipoyltransferase 2, mitochondrial [Polyrhizophydium stewartii]
MPATSLARSIGVKYLGAGVSYARALAVQQHLVQQRVAAAAEAKAASRPLVGPPDVLLLLQHAPTFTAGRRIRGSDDTEGERLRGLGAEYFETMRGGQTTFHGPGQLLGARTYVERLEQFLIETCLQYDISAGTTKDTGVWVADRKIAALGIHISRHITSHGFALNCNTDLSWFDHIVPCGLPDKKVTSITHELASRRPLAGSASPTDVTVDSALPVAVKAFGALFGADMVPLDRICARTDREIEALLDSEASGGSGPAQPLRTQAPDSEASAAAAAT